LRCETLGLSEQVRVREKEYRHVKGLAQMILDQRSEVETFFLEALEQIKREYRKKVEQERKESITGSTALREVFPQALYE
jgi:hypothetical protein